MPAGTHPIFGSFRLNHKGYPRLNSRKFGQKFLHRAVFEQVAGRPVRPGFDIHHMAGKRCFCPHNLIEIQRELHPAPRVLRCPYTGEFLSVDGYVRRFGHLPLGMSA
jgi:hypothetical protein